MSTMPWPVKSSRIAYQNPWITVHHEEVTRPDGSDGIYGVIETNGASFIVAVDEQRRVCLVTTDRHTVGPSTEIPAGGLDANETDALAAARRELLEEVGLEATGWTHLSSMAALNGVGRIAHHVFLAEGLSHKQDPSAEQAKEAITNQQWLPLDEALDWCATGRITDGDTVAALGLAKLYIERIDRLGVAKDANIAAPDGSDPLAGRPRWRRWLAQEGARHLIALAVMLVVLGLGQIEAIWQALHLTGAKWRTITTALCALSLYGPVQAITTYLAFSGLRGEALRSEMRRTQPSERQRRLLGYSPSWVAASVSIAAIAGIFFLMVAKAFGANSIVSTPAITTIASTWILLVVLFSVEFARLWAENGGVSFPDDHEAERCMSDFFYVSSQVGTTFATRDVSMTSTTARRLATLESIVAFVLGTVVIALLLSLIV